MAPAALRASKYEHSRRDFDLSPHSPLSRREIAVSLYHQRLTTITFFHPSSPFFSMGVIDPVMISRILLFAAACSFLFPVQVYSGKLELPEIAAEEVNCLTTIPSAISPNGDGVNDLFEIHHDCLVTRFSLTIFDQQGRAIYQTEQTTPSWDGMTNGQPAPEGHYRWRISYQTTNGERVEKEGEVLLVR